MCEPATSKATGWQGWSDLPAPEASRALGPWVDLSHPITETLSRAPSFPQPRIRQIATMFLGLNIVGSDGAPARVVARPID
jgi:kynurenine formamidase